MLKIIILNRQNMCYTILKMFILLYRLIERLMSDDNKSNSINYLMLYRLLLMRTNPAKVLD